MAQGEAECRASGCCRTFKSLAGPSTQASSSPLSSSDGRLVRPLTGFSNPASEVAFLRAAVERIAALGGDPKASVVAVELDPAVHRHP